MHIVFLYIRRLILPKNIVSSLENQNKKNYRFLIGNGYFRQFKNTVTFVYLKRVVSILIGVQTYRVQTDEIEQFTDILNTVCFSMLK